MSGPYDDIINLPHHVSAHRPQMPAANRAAQFAPFAALTGYEAAIKETGRLTDARIELDGDAMAALDFKLRLLEDALADRPEVTITYFQPDESKEGGAYVSAAGIVKRIDMYEGQIVMMGGERISIADVLEVESELYKGLPY